ncbi:MAG: hypothetical protein JJU02_07775 [Cryomorphaceae bacterium]|nr:hypothetical protein [Cryomorphaceae bacterium]
MKNFSFVLPSVLMVALLLSCSKEEGFEPDSNELKSIKIGVFTLEVPENFKLVEKNGIDSYVGYLVGNSPLEIHFDYGIYTMPFEDFDQDIYMYDYSTQGSVERQILISKNLLKHSSRLHIRDTSHIVLNQPISLSMRTENALGNQQELVTSIFHSCELSN